MRRTARGDEWGRQRRAVQVQGAHVPHHDLGVRAGPAVLPPGWRVAGAVPAREQLHLELKHSLLLRLNEVSG